jgi:hypothetical protein
VKQTKPFGRACLTPTETDRTPNPPQNEQLTRAIAPDIEDRQVAVDLFDIRGTAPLDATSTGVAGGWIKRLRDGSVILGALATLLAVYVGMRDNMVLSRMLDVVPTDETVLLCKDGQVKYGAGGGVLASLSDRLFNRGHLVCTDWRIQSGFRTAPRY